MFCTPMSFSHKFLGASAKLWKATVSLSCLSVCLSAWNKSAPNGRISLKFDISEFSENPSGKLICFFYDNISLNSP